MVYLYSEYLFFELCLFTREGETERISNPYGKFDDLSSQELTKISALKTHHQNLLESKLGLRRTMAMIHAMLLLFSFLGPQIINFFRMV
jgi:hypothetical protein